MGSPADRLVQRVQRALRRPGTAGGSRNMASKDVVVLRQRLAGLQALGPEFDHVDFSSYVAVYDATARRRVRGECVATEA